MLWAWTSRDAGPPSPSLFLSLSVDDSPVFRHVECLCAQVFSSPVPPSPSLSLSLSSFSYPSSTMSPPLPLASFFLYPDYGRAHGFFSASTLRFLVSRTLYLVQSHPQSLSLPVTRGDEVREREDREGMERERERERRIEIKATSQTRRLRSSPLSPSSSFSSSSSLLRIPLSLSLSFFRARNTLLE